MRESRGRRPGALIPFPSPSSRCWPPCRLSTAMSSTSQQFMESAAVPADLYLKMREDYNLQSMSVWDDSRSAEPMNKVAFYSGLILLVIGLLIWIVRPHQSSQRNEINLFGARFTFDTPAFAVMAIGLALMMFSPTFPETLGSLPPTPIKKIVCTGEKRRTLSWAI